jgi:hypothetical protein
MFSKTSDVKVLRNFSPPWNIINDTDIKLPAVYEFLYKLNPTEIHLSLTRNTRVGTLVCANVFYKDYLVVFNFQNRSAYDAWVHVYKNGMEVATCDISYEMAYSLIKLFPKQLRKTFKTLLLADNLPNKWNYIKQYLDKFTPINGTIVKVPTVLKLEILQAGAYPLQIANTEKVTKTYYYFKD